MNEQELLMVEQTTKIKIDQINILNPKRWEIGITKPDEMNSNFFK